jgi:hypothetical protein
VPDHSGETYGPVGSELVSADPHMDGANRPAAEARLIKAALDLRIRAEQAAGSPAPGTLERVAMNQRRKLEWAQANGERGTNIADMADKMALQIYRADLTLSEFLQERVTEWYRGVEAHGFSILDYLGMTRDEYAAWVVDDVISDRIQRIQLRPYVLHILRRY